MTKNFKFILLFVLIVLMGLLGSACSSNEAAIDQAVQQTVEAQQTNQDSSGQSVSNTDSPAQDMSVEPTEPVSTPIDSATNEHVSTTPEETAVTAPTIADSDSQRILFTASEEGANNLFSIKPNGEDLQNVTNFDTFYMISVSPDLSHVAYTINDLVLGYGGDDSVDSNSGMHVIPISDINNPSPELISGSEDIFALNYPIWSPDNSQIAMFGTRLDNTGLYDRGLYVIDIEADEINFLVEDDAVEYIAWSPDGERLAFVSEENNRSALPILFIVNEDGSNLTNLLIDPNSRYIHTLVWSSDGTNITFDQIDDTNRDQTISIDVNSGLLTDQTDNKVADNRGVWSPDGTKLVFRDRKDDPNGDYDSNFELYVINADGSNLLQFTEYEPSTVFDRCPIWSPDSTQLVFISMTYGNIDELTVSDGNNRTVLMSDSEDINIDCPIAWTP